MAAADRFKSGRLIFLLLGLFAAGGACAAPDAARRAELIRMVRNDCGSCHGLQLTGGLGLPLTPEALREKPDDSLVATILYGRPDTPMPPWQAFLSEAEAGWIVAKLKQGFPDVSPH
ncbi:MAG: cytochrome c [Proteobacteria bacterium]|nr:cytochrome c [Pseudomonadota bacterium]